MSFLPHVDPTDLIALYGYWAVAVVVGLESMGIPLPGETILVAAAIWAGARHDLNIAGVVAAASAGAIVGDSIGYWIGRTVGFRVLAHYGRRIGLTEERLKLGQYLFLRYGAVIVFFGRFVALLRTLAAFLAGVNQMSWPRFLFFNVTGGILWASVFGLGGYLFGQSIRYVGGPISLALLVAGVVAAIAAFFFIRSHEQRMIAEAERALPGPLAGHPRRDAHLEG
jgi:membrane protein DedA with SNARE-associated domain